MSGLKELISEAADGKGISAEDAERIIAEASEKEWQRVFEVAAFLNAANFRKRLHFFAPLYFSNHCMNYCRYCGFHVGNKKLERVTLSTEELLQEAKWLWDQGHRTLLLLAGEHPAHSGVEQIAAYLSALMRSGMKFSIMVEVGPLSREDYMTLRYYGVNHCLLYQETYNRQIYKKMHMGRKADYEWRFEAMIRAREAGIENAGLGILLGLDDWRSDLISLFRHAALLQEKTGREPATFSFPRLKPSAGEPEITDHLVSDDDFRKILSVSRLVFPSTGVVLSTRETPELRRSLISAGSGITHVSACSVAVPGGYTIYKNSEKSGQFELADQRSLQEVVEDVRQLGYQAEMHCPEIQGAVYE